MEYTDTKELEAAVEGILFASGEPIQTDRICLALSMERADVEDVLRRLRDYYAFERRGMRLLQLEDKWQLCSSPDHAEVIRKAFEIRKPAKLSQPALEALTIIAYYQPTTRAYVDKLRGVDSAYTVGLLLERGLIETCGNLQAPGRPLLYRTTEKFLRSFHIRSLDELPPLNEDDAPPQQLKIEDMAQRLADTPQASDETQTPEAAQASDETQVPEAAEAIPARELMSAGYPKIVAAPRRQTRKPTPRKPKRLAEAFRTRRKRPGRNKRKRRRTARPGRGASDAEARHGAAPTYDEIPAYDGLPENAETYDEIPETTETYDEIPETTETYDETPEYGEPPETAEFTKSPPSGKGKRKRPARKIKRLVGTFRPRKRPKRPQPNGRKPREAQPSRTPAPAVSEKNDAQADGVDAQAGASGNGAARRKPSVKAARRCLHCMLCGLWLSWPFCSF